MLKKLKIFLKEFKKIKAPDWERMFCLGTMRFPV